MRSFKLATGAAVILVLAACGGGGGSSVNGFAALDETYIDIIEQIEAENFIATDPLVPPPSGASVYRGVLGLGSNNFAIAGEATVTATWRDNTFSGSATNFVTENDVALSGTLQIENGALDLAENATEGFTANLTGILENETTYDATIGGSFYGDNYDTLLGTVAGTATSYGTTRDVTGILLGER